MRFIVICESRRDFVDSGSFQFCPCLLWELDGQYSAGWGRCSTGPRCPLVRKNLRFVKGGHFCNISPNRYCGAWLWLAIAFLTWNLFDWATPTPVNGHSSNSYSNGYFGPGLRCFWCRFGLGHQMLRAGCRRCRLLRVVIFDLMSSSYFDW